MHADPTAVLPDIRKTALLNAPIQRVWEAIATAEGLAGWYMPNDFQPQTGQKFLLQSPFGPTACNVLEIDPPRRLSFSWDDFGWLVTFELKKVGDKTELTVIHGGWGAPEEIIARAGQPQSVIHGIMNNGWEPLINEKLREAVEG